MDFLKFYGGEIRRHCLKFKYVISLIQNAAPLKLQMRIYPQKSKSLNLAFDVTPAKLVTGLITEKGVCEASEKGLKELFK